MKFSEKVSDPDGAKHPKGRFGHRGQTPFPKIASLAFVWLVAAQVVLGQALAVSKTTMIVVVGASGETQYGDQFAEWAEAWTKVCETAGIEVSVIGTESAEPSEDLEQLRKRFESLASSSKASDTLAEPFWLVLIGHGTFQSNVAKFNLRGPDLSAEQLSKWIDAVKRPTVIVNTSSASGPFINSLSGEGRVIVTATKNGEEQNFARFGAYLPKAIGNQKSDLDHDGEVSLLEAVVKASSDTNGFYLAEDRIVTEHALLDDNGDKLGTPAEMLRLILRGDEVRAAQKKQTKSKSVEPASDVDGDRAISTVLVPSSDSPDLLPGERNRRAAIEAEIRRLRRGKGSSDEDEYYAKLEVLLVELAKIYASAEMRENGK